MANQQRSEVGRFRGHRYILDYAKRGDMQACVACYRNEWRWFLTLDGNAEGDFRTLAEAIAYLDKEYPLPRLV